MVNEEDHLRIQVMHSGLDLQAAWEQINQIDDLIEERVTYAFNERWGYLTACPTNVGTGMRVSVMLHLPALVITRQIEKVFRSLQKISLAVRGLYGEGSQAMGDFYQISNQITLGRSEQELIAQIGDVVPVLIDYERRAREFLVRESQKDLHDRVSRAYGILCTAQTISSEETMHLLSSVRMGINLGLIDDLEIPTVNKLFIHTQPAHLQKLRGIELDTADRNIERANYLQLHLRKHENGDDAGEELSLSRSAIITSPKRLNSHIVSPPTASAGAGSWSGYLGMISAGTNRASISSVETGVICLIRLLDTCARSSSAIRKMVSTSSANCRLASSIVNSAATSVSGRMPRIMTLASHSRTNSTASPRKVRTSTLGQSAVTRRIIATRSSAVNSGCFSMLIPTPTISLSTNRDAR